MSKIEWHEGLSLGVEEIDDQHRNLIAIVNDVLSAFEKGEKDSAIDDLLSKLKEYAVLHFSTEEKYMEKIDYPQLGEHRQLHEGLKNRVKSLQAARFHREEVTPKDVKDLLGNWLVDHLLHEDYKIAQFAKKNKSEFNP